MKVAIWIIVGGVLSGTYVLTGMWAFGYGVKTALKQKLREYGIHKDMLPLYQRAMKLVNRLAQLTDLDGAMAGDQLSPETRKLVTDLVADYKKEIRKP